MSESTEPTDHRELQSGPDFGALASKAMKVGGIPIRISIVAARAAWVALAGEIETLRGKD